MNEEKENTVNVTPEVREESKLDKLTNELANTNRLLARTFSLRMIIFRGLITGLTIVIGSTLVAGVVLQALRVTFGDIPYIN